MPAKKEFGMRGNCAYPEGPIAVTGRPVSRTRGPGLVANAALHSACVGVCENTSKPNNLKGQCHPRLARSGALADITNVGAGFALPVDQKLKPVQISLQQHLQPLALSKGLESQATMEEKSIGVDQTLCECRDAEQSNVQDVQEYATDILNQLFRAETTSLPRADYMSAQTDITGKMRMILIDWLIEVHTKYRLCPETLHLAVNLIDRYLARTPVIRKRLQLVGVVAMCIASKFEDIRPPEIHEWVYLTDNAYKKEDLLTMECHMLSTISFQIMVPTAPHFFEALQNANGCDGVQRELCQYLLELSLLDMRMLPHTPSHMVAAALLLSNELLKRKPVWPESMVQLSRNTEQALQGCVRDLRLLLDADHAGAGGQLQAVHKKFSVTQRHAVSEMKF